MNGSGRHRGRMRAARVFVVVGGVLATAALLVGGLNRHVFDGPTFAAHVDEIRQDDDVAASVGLAISDQLIAAHPDLVALQPLVEALAIRAAGGDLLSGPTRAAARVTHRALVSSDDDSMSLRIGDRGSIAAVLAALAPDRVNTTTAVSVTLLAVDDWELASTISAIAHSIDTLAWVLPIAALACFSAAIGLSTSRWRTAASVGRAIVWSAAAVGVALVIGSFAVRQLDPDTLGGAVARAAWREMIRPLWWYVILAAALGIATVMACGAAAQASLGPVIRAVLAAAIGVAALSDPLGVLEPLMMLAGGGLVVYAIMEFARLRATARARARADSDPDATAVSGDASGRRAMSPRTARVVLIGVGLIAAGAVVFQAWPGGDVDVVEAAPVTSCNGHEELCDRRFDEVAYAASHNAMSVAGAPGWFLAEQADPIVDQLEQGVRALLVDVWSGRQADTVVRTAASSYEEALLVAQAELGPEVVAAAGRIADSIAGEASGPEARYLCHGLCETGSTPFLEMLAELDAWMSAHPHEVVTMFIEDHVDADLIAGDFERAGLDTLTYTPTVGEPWPTLREMIAADQRFVVLLEAGHGGPDAPWLANGFEIIQETPYTFPTVESFSCEPNRGPADAPLFLLNHWLSGFNSLVTDAQLVNGRDILLERAEQCRRERGQIPNFVAVNFVAYGDVFAVVDMLNGVS